MATAVSVGKVIRRSQLTMLVESRTMWKAMLLHMTTNHLTNGATNSRLGAKQLYRERVSGSRLLILYSSICIFECAKSEISTKKTTCAERMTQITSLEDSENSTWANTSNVSSCCICLCNSITSLDWNRSSFMIIAYCDVAYFPSNLVQGVPKDTMYA